MGRFVGAFTEAARCTDLYHAAGGADDNAPTLQQMLLEWAKDAGVAPRKFQPTNDGARVMPHGVRGYRFLSGFTHGTPVATGLGGRRRDAGAETAVSWQGYDLRLHVRTCVYAVEAAQAAVRAFDSYWGGSGERRRFPDVLIELRSVGGSDIC